MSTTKTILSIIVPCPSEDRPFLRAFRGREDVYPRRFESRQTGKSGYSPACANEWVRGVCESFVKSRLARNDASCGYG